MNHWSGAVCVAAVCASISQARADAPGYLPIQGYLSDAQGKAVDGSVSITFSLYDAETDGTKLFEETQPVVNVENGYFTAYLGEKATLDLDLFRDRPIVFVGILVSGDSEELSPRLQLATVPYAAYSQHAGNAATLGGKAASAFMAAEATIPWTSVTGAPNYTAGAGLSLSGTTLNTSSVQTKLGSDCPAGQYAYGVNTDGGLKCRVDVDTNAGGDITAVQAGAGISVANGTSGAATVSLDLGLEQKQADWAFPEIPDSMPTPPASIPSGWRFTYFPWDSESIACSSGKVVLSGGCQTNHDEWMLASSGPSADRRSWVCQAKGIALLFPPNIGGRNGADAYANGKKWVVCVNESAIPAP
jgi:hypothetical protein